MADQRKARTQTDVTARCDLDEASFGIAISDISCEGCLIEAGRTWDEDSEFLHLRIDGRIDVNGQMVWHEGKRAGIRFFGQIHPLVVEDLSAKS